MQVKLEGSCGIGKAMSTGRKKLGTGEDGIVACRVKVSGVRVKRREMEELAGMPEGSTETLFRDEDLCPHQKMSFLLPARALMVTGSIEHKRDSGATVGKLEYKKPAVASDIRFSLDKPDDQGAGSLMSFFLTWKAAGDEVEDFEPLAGRTCYMHLTFKPEGQQPLFSDAKPNRQQEEAAGTRAKLDRKRLAAGEKETDGDDPIAASGEADPLFGKVKEYAAGQDSINVVKLQNEFKIGYNRAVGLGIALEAAGLVGPMNPLGAREVKRVKGKGKSKVTDISLGSLEREAREHAKKHPRRDPPKPRKR